MHEQQEVLQMGLQYTEVPWLSGSTRGAQAPHLGSRILETRQVEDRQKLPADLRSSRSINCSTRSTWASTRASLLYRKETTTAPFDSKATCC